MKTQSVVQQTNKNTFQGNVNIEKLFELAIDTANEGYKLKAMQIAREALIFAKQKNDYTAVYIHSFLAVLCMDVLKFSSARIHLYSALNKLNTKHYSYITDYNYINALLKKLEKLDQTEDVFTEPIAA